MGFAAKLRVVNRRVLLTVGFALYASLSLAQGSLESLLAKARSEEAAGNYPDAEETYRQALVAAPKDLETLKRLGVLLQTELKFSESIQVFQQVLQGDANYSQVNFFLGVSYFGQNEIPKAIDSLQAELKTQDPHPRTRFYLSNFLQSAGKFDAAISELNKLLAENPNDPDALYELSRLHKNASFQAMERLKSIDPDAFQVHLLLGELYADENRYPEAIKEYETALLRRPNAQGVHFAIGVAHWSEHRYEEAGQEFSKALRENPSDGLTNLYLGDIAVRNGKFDTALAYLQIAQKMRADIPQLHLLLGKCLQGQNQLEQAKAEFLAAIQADPSAPQPHYLLGQVYRRLKEQEASASEFAKFEELSKAQSANTQLTTGMGSNH